MLLQIQKLKCEKTYTTGDDTDRKDISNKEYMEAHVVMPDIGGLGYSAWSHCELLVFIKKARIM